MYAKDKNDLYLMVNRLLKNRLYRLVPNNILLLATACSQPKLLIIYKGQLTEV